MTTVSAIVNLLIGDERAGAEFAERVAKRGGKNAEAYAEAAEILREIAERKEKTYIEKIDHEELRREIHNMLSSASKGKN